MSASSLPPNLQAVLANLFELFGAYVAATSSREKSVIHSQILDLFSRLGVVSDSVIVREAADLFDRIKQEPTTELQREATLANEAREFVAARLRAFERTRNGPALSTGARQMLRTPVVEVAEFAGQFDPGQVGRALETLFADLAEPPASRAEGTDHVRTSVAVIRAFSKNFCRIPPFCSGRAQK